MKRAQSMAQAAWARPGPSLRSWSCIGPRRRTSTAEMTCEVTEDPSESSSTQLDSSKPFLTSIEETTADLPLSSSLDNSTADITLEDTNDYEGDDSDDIMDSAKFQDRMTEVELWQQIERELYEQVGPDGVDETVQEIREEEEAAIEEVSDPQSQSSIPNTKEVHRFFPAGRIMHIVTQVLEHSDREHESNGSSESDDGKEEETEVAIFLTPRSLYSKLRLSQTMIADHFMPVYRREIEKLIKLHESEGISDNHTQEIC